MKNLFLKRWATVVLIAGQMVAVNGVYGHGEGRAGPHGGVIRMPGGFHTEVKPLSDHKIAVYLLDIQLKNPSVKDSTLEVSIRRETETLRLTCAEEKLRYVCALPKNQSLKKSGELTVRASREGMQGVDAKYPLPLLVPSS